MFSENQQPQPQPDQLSKLTTQLLGTYTVIEKKKTGIQKEIKKRYIKKEYPPKLGPDGKTLIKRGPWTEQEKNMYYRLCEKFKDECKQSKTKELFEAILNCLRTRDITQVRGYHNKHNPYLENIVIKDKKRIRRNKEEMSKFREWQLVHKRKYKEREKKKEKNKLFEERKKLAQELLIQERQKELEVFEYFNCEGNKVPIKVFINKQYDFDLKIEEESSLNEQLQQHQNSQENNEMNQKMLQQQIIQKNQIQNDDSCKVEQDEEEEQQKLLNNKNNYQQHQQNNINQNQNQKIQLSKQYNQQIKVPQFQKQNEINNNQFIQQKERDEDKKVQRQIQIQKILSHLYTPSENVPNYKELEFSDKPIKIDCEQLFPQNLQLLEKETQYKKMKELEKIKLEAENITDWNIVEQVKQIDKQLLIGIQQSIAKQQKNKIQNNKNNANNIKQTDSYFRIINEFVDQDNKKTPEIITIDDDKSSVASIKISEDDQEDFKKQYSKEEIRNQVNVNQVEKNIPQNNTIQQHPNLSELDDVKSEDKSSESKIQQQINQKEPSVQSGNLSFKQLIKQIETNKSSQPLSKADEPKYEDDLPNQILTRNQQAQLKKDLEEKKQQQQKIPKYVEIQKPQILQSDIALQNRPVVICPIPIPYIDPQSLQKQTDQEKYQNLVNKDAQPIKKINRPENEKPQKNQNKKQQKIKQQQQQQQQQITKNEQPIIDDSQNQQSIQKVEDQIQIQPIQNQYLEQFQQFQQNSQFYPKQLINSMPFLQDLSQFPQFVLAPQFQSQIPLEFIQQQATQANTNSENQPIIQPTFPDLQQLASLQQAFPIFPQAMIPQYQGNDQQLFNQYQQSQQQQFLLQQFQQQFLQHQQATLTNPQANISQNQADQEQQLVGVPNQNQRINYQINQQEAQTNNNQNGQQKVEMMYVYSEVPHNFDPNFFFQFSPQSFEFIPKGSQLDGLLK